VDEPVLVTGGSGYVGGHTIVRLLQEGHRVRTTVRGPEREPEVRAVAAAGGADPAGVEVVVADLGSDAGWDAATAGVRYVLHVASPFPAAAVADEDEVIRPAVDGTLRVLAAARRAGVQRVVLTSSFAAVGYGARSREVYTEDDWTDPSDPNPAYVRSKAIAERAAWDDVRTAGGPELSVVNPVGIFGPVLGPHRSASVRMVAALLDGQVPAGAPPYFGVVDVRDVADLHVRAMTSPQAPGRRFLAVAGEPISLGEMARILADGLGPVAAAVPTVGPGSGGRRPVISSARARSVLGWEPRDVRTVVLDTARSLLGRAPGTREPAPAWV
jgi:nucleoside-diphosphate-sugar epimerase